MPTPAWFQAVITNKDCNNTINKCNSIIIHNLSLLPTKRVVATNSIPDWVSQLVSPNLPESCIQQVHRLLIRLQMFHQHQSHLVLAISPLQKWTTQNRQIISKTNSIMSRLSLAEEIIWAKLLSVTDSIPELWLMFTKKVQMLHPAIGSWAVKRELLYNSHLSESLWHLVNNCLILKRNVVNCTKSLTKKTHSTCKRKNSKFSSFKLLWKHLTIRSIYNPQRNKKMKFLSSVSKLFKMLKVTLKVLLRKLLLRWILIRKKAANTNWFYNKKTMP